MDYIGFIRRSDGLAYALTYGTQADMEAWADLTKVTDPTTALYAAQPGDDVPRCLTDSAYFQSLNP